MSAGTMDLAVPDAEAFDATAFVGLARSAKRDAYRLSLFAQHLEPNERPRVVLPVRGGTLIVTDERLLELRAHLEVHGAWNVREFQGYTLHRTLHLNSVREAVHEVQRARDGDRAVEDRIRLRTDEGPEEFIVSRGPEPTLSESDFDVVRTAILSPQRM